MNDELEDIYYNDCLLLENEEKVILNTLVGNIT